jgi:hypothetical protein
MGRLFLSKCGNSFLTRRNKLQLNFGNFMDKSAKLGLWDRIRAKRERGEAPAKPGDKDFPDSKMWKKLTNKPKKQAAASPAWQRASGKNPEGGLNEKGRKSYERETGGNLKAPVTESNPKGDRAKRQNSFCSRMCGMKRVNTGSKAKKDPDSRINKSLRKWNCKCSNAREFGAELSKLAFLGAGTGIGTVAGLVTGKKNDRANAALRGGLKGFGWDLGAGAGAGLGMAAGLSMGGGSPQAALYGGVGGALGGLAGGLTGYGLTDSALGPYETEQEKFDRLLAEREKKMRKQLDTTESEPREVGEKYAELMMAPEGSRFAPPPAPPIVDLDAVSKDLGPLIRAETPASSVTSASPLLPGLDGKPLTPAEIVRAKINDPALASVPNKPAQEPKPAPAPAPAPVPVPAPAPAPASAPSQSSNWPLVVAGGGLSAAGLLGLYYMMKERDKPKKRRDDD